MASSNLDKLKRLLAELFQLDQADLDFGIFRIMNQKRDDIVHFLDDDLLPQVKQAFRQYQSTDRAAIQVELDQAIESARSLGADLDTVPKVQELRAKLEESGVDIAALESEVFSHLYSFFRRYYHEGDFLSLRRYKEGVYAIPYEGEEVKLHWANADQYYIKSSEYLRDYTFKLPSGKRVHFKLVEASTEQDNNKAANGKERRFILCEQDALVEENGELTIRFDYRPDEDKRKQKDLSGEAEKTVLGSDGFDEWTRALSTLAPTEANPDRTLLAKHLNDYTARNTFDYFIHKDLGGFLRRELDFYIKNEVMHLDDIEGETAPRVEQYLSKIKALRSIAHKIIAFLEQLENFQKKLWLKKKFVVETNYCVTLDRVPEELYEQIAANDAQREEWVRLFAIDEIEADLAVAVAYSTPLTVEFLKANPFLVLDTRFFDEVFKDALLQGIEGLDEQTDGLLVHGENFQALSLLHCRFRGQIKCIYNDPPYNTGKDGFPYKEQYRHSTWLSMMLDRLALGRDFLSVDGVALTSVDDREVVRLLAALDSTFGDTGHISTLIWNTEGHTDNQYDIKENHEYIPMYARDASRVEIGFVVDPNTREESNLWKGFAENSITKNGPGNPPSEIELPVGFPCKTETLDLPSNDPGKDFFAEADNVGYITRDLTARFGVAYPIRRDSMIARENKLEQPCRVYTGWANANKLRRFIEEGCTALDETDGTISFFLSERGVIYYRKDRSRARNIVSVLRNLGTTEQMRSELEDMGIVFAYPKPKQLLAYLVRIGAGEGGYVMDFFAGSGTTGQATIEIARAESERWRTILVEVGDYFDNVLKSRIQKVVYSEDWKDGKPVSREGSSHMFKYIRLESYEDALNNLALKRTDGQQALLDDLPEVREEYMLSYMLDVESRGSASLLDVDAFDDPYAYKMKIARGDETEAVYVDLIETFNYLIGLTVKHIDHIRGVRVISGTSPDGERVLVLWRKVDEIDNDALDKWFTRQGYNSRDMEYDLIYVNGDNNLENLRREDHTWKVRLIEEDFHRLMFDVEDV